MRLRIRNGTLVSASGSNRTDIVCQDGAVEGLGADEAPAASIDADIDASGLLVFPGFIDPHVHSRDPGLTYKEDFAHSTRAAAAGGVTTICEMPNAIPPVSSAAIFEARAAQHASVASVDFGLWGIALGPENLTQIAGLFAAGAVGVKLFWGYALHRSTHMLVYNLSDAAPEDLIQPPTSSEVLEVCREVVRAGGLLAAHCEDRGVIDTAERRLGRPIQTYAELLQIRPNTAEAASVTLAGELSRATGCRFHVVHITSALGLDALRKARAAGARLTAETCPHYLTLSAGDFPALGVGMKVFPPIREQADQAALWQAVEDGTIASIGSDHAPHSRAEKGLGLAVAPAGVSGVETMAPLLIDAMLAGRLSAERLAAILSEDTARLYGLYPRKGSFEAGADADFTLVDPESTTDVDAAKLHSKEPQTLWQGRRLRGAVEWTILRGEVIARRGEVLDGPRGRLVRAIHSSS